MALVEHKSHTITLDGLPDPVRRNVAKWLRENDPEFLDGLHQLQNDPFFLELKATFDGVVVYTVHGELPAAFDGIPDNAVTTRRRLLYR